MNIFILHKNPKINAIYHCDKHIVKMPLETAQILCTVLHVWGLNQSIPYKPTHKNHPSVKWATESYANFVLLVKIGRELCDEFQFRFNKIHSCKAVIDRCYYEALVPEDRKGDVTSLPQAMPDEYKDIDVVKAYRNYYNGAKKHLHKWTKRKTPKFIYNERTN